MRKTVLAFVLVLSLLLSSCIVATPSGESSSASSDKTSAAETSSGKSISDLTESSAAEASKAESSAEEASKEDSSKAESSKEESSKAESSKEESSKAESSKEESSKTESSKEESSKAESSKEESSKAESSKEESSKAESSAEESSKEDSSKAESSKEESSASTNTAKEFSLGTTADGTYENAYFGIGVKPGDDWIFYSTEELATTSGISADQMTVESVKELLAKQQTVFDMFAMSSDGLRTMNVVFEDLGTVYGALLDESGYIDIALSKLAPSLEAQGFKNIVTEKGSLEFAGSEHGIIRLTSQMSVNNIDIDVYEMVIVIKQDNYITSVTLASFMEDHVAEMAEWFYAVK